MSSDRSSLCESGNDAAWLLGGLARQKAVAAADLFTPEALRLGDRQRIGIRDLLSGTIDAIEADLRAALARDAEAPPPVHSPVARAALQQAGLLDDPELVFVLAWRLEAHRVHLARKPGGDALLRDLAADADPAIAEAAASLAAAQNGRLGRFDEPVLLRAEMPAALRHRLVWAVAAALRHDLVAAETMTGSAADDALAAAASVLLGDRRVSASLDVRAAALARALAEADRLDDALIERVLTENSLALFTAALAVRAGLSSSAVAELLCDRSGDGAALLLRAAGIARPHAASILLFLFSPHDVAGEDQVAALLRRFDALDADAARASLGLWRADAHYRAALIRLDPALAKARAA